MRHQVMMLLLALGACTRQTGQETAPQNEQQRPVANQQSAATNELHPPGPRETLEEPKRPIDPKSIEAAGQVVQSYGALIEQGRWDEANALWGSTDAAAKFQATAFAGAKEVHLGIGNLGEPEGAAGSIYVTMPVVFYGDGKDGNRSGGRPKSSCGGSTTCPAQPKPSGAGTSSASTWRAARISSALPSAALHSPA